MPKYPAEEGVRVATPKPGDGKWPCVCDSQALVNTRLLVGDYREALQSPHRCFRGSVVESGEAVLVVDSVGADSVFGKMQVELATTDTRDAPLKIKLSNLADGVAFLGYVGASFIAVAFLFKQVIGER